MIIHLFVIFVLIVLCMDQISAYKILMLPLGNRSHLLEFHGLGSVLMARGHEVYIFATRADTPPRR